MCTEYYNLENRIASKVEVMKWMIACQLFVLFALLEFGFVLFCRFVFKYKSLPKDYGEKQLMQLDFICLMI